MKFGTETITVTGFNSKGKKVGEVVAYRDLKAGEFVIGGMHTIEKFRKRGVGGPLLDARYQ